jgi:hypothetical protein
MNRSNTPMSTTKDGPNKKRPRSSEAITPDNLERRKGASAIKRAKNLMVLETDTVGRLEEFDEKSHWTSDMVMHQLQEPARGLTTRRDLLIVAFYAHTDKVVKVGQDKQYSLTAVEGASRFLADHFDLRRIGIQSLITTTSHGAKYLVDVTDVPNAVVRTLPTELIKLAKGTGMEVSKLGDPMNTINMSVAYALRARKSGQKDGMGQKGGKTTKKRSNIAEWLSAPSINCI